MSDKLLLETNDYILQETSDFILLENTSYIISFLETIGLAETFKGDMTSNSSDSIGTTDTISVLKGAIITIIDTIGLKDKFKSITKIWKNIDKTTISTFTNVTKNISTMTGQVKSAVSNFINQKKSN